MSWHGIGKNCGYLALGCNIRWVLCGACVGVNKTTTTLLSLDSVCVCFFFFSYFPDIAEVLDEEFSTLENLTDGHLHDTQTDTEPLRVAIQRYASGIYGTQDDM